MKQELIEKIVKEGNTPAYVFDVEVLKKRLSFMRAILGDNLNIQLCYAMKANPFLVKVLETLVDKYEVCSPGELSICKKKDIDMGKIVMSGVNKEKEDVERALEWGVDIFTIESRAQLNLIQECAGIQNKTVQVLLRLTSGNQFGMDKAEVLDIIEHKNEFSNLVVKGIQYYSGTQKKVKKIKEEMESLYDFCQELEQDHQFKAEVLEYGPGFGIDYFGKEENTGKVLEECREVFEKASMMKLQLTLEMGRFLAAECGSYLTKVMDVKRNDGQNYCIVDGGINHVNYYGQVMGVRIPPVKYYPVTRNYVEEPIVDGKQNTESVCVCGSLCTVADVLIRSIAVTDVKEGDLFVFEKIGAYSMTEGIYLFLSRQMPKIYLLQEEKLELIRDSYETYQFNIG